MTQMCKSKLADHPTLLMLLLFAILVIDVLGLQPDLHGPGRAAASGRLHRDDHDRQRFLPDHAEPAHRGGRPQGGRTPDAKYGKIAKVRSTHNNYLTLPVVFLMLSNHYPLAFATEYSWIIASLIFLTGVTIRHYFNTMHATGSRGGLLDMGGHRNLDADHRLAVGGADA